MDFKSFIKNLVTFGGEDRKFIRETDEYIEAASKRMDKLTEEIDDLLELAGKKSPSE